jgi:hypothetical protein
MLNENTPPFLGGFIMGGWSSVSVWANSQPLFVQDFLINVGSTLVLGLVGGIAGMIAKDGYSYVKNKFTKNDKDEFNQGHDSGSKS